MVRRDIAALVLGPIVAPRARRRLLRHARDEQRPQPDTARLSRPEVVVPIPRQAEAVDP